MKHELITTDGQLQDYCGTLAGVERIAFDTEFVSEDTYRPQLCLIQVAAAGRLAVIDPLDIQDLSPFWRVLSEGEHETVVHAGRQEVEFSLAAVGCVPKRLFDVQIAAGMIGIEYPASYGSLVSKILGETPQKGETRTDWRRRPLTDRQLEYALADVDHLELLREKLGQRLERLKRTEWFASEMTDWLNDVQDAQNRERWRKVAGSSGLAATRPGSRARNLDMARVRGRAAQLPGEAGAARRFDRRTRATAVGRPEANPRHSRHGARRPEPGHSGSVGGDRSGTEEA